MSNGLQTLTIAHVATGLVAIVTGFVVMSGLFRSKRLDQWTAIFLFSTALTSITGFYFPSEGFTPAKGLGILSLIALGLGGTARYAKEMAGRWRTVYVVGAVVSLYFNVLVLVTQSFQKIPSLHDLAPTQSAPPLFVAQFVVLAFFVAIGFLAEARFRPQAIRAQQNNPSVSAVAS